MSRNLCRICLTDQNCFISIREHIGNELILSIINKIAEISLSEVEDFPQMVCNLCYKRLRDFLILKDEIRQTEKLLQSQKIEILEEPVDRKIEIEYLLDDPEAEEALMEDDYEEFEVVEPEEVQKNIKEDTKNESNEVLFPLLSKWTCCFCDASFTDEKSCENHVNISHPDAVAVNTEENKNLKFSCPICHKGFRRKKSIGKHLFDKSFIEDLTRKPDESRKLEKSCPCHACGKLFTDKFEAKKHYDRVHETNKRVKCEKCEKRFATQKLLNRHMISHAPKTFKCDKCEKSFPQMTQLRSHLDRHLTIKRFKCDSCPKTYSLKRLLDTHILQHAEEKPFKCLQCPKKYKWPEDLKAHTKAEHEGIFPFTCVYCNKGYTSSSNKKYHEKRCRLNPAYNSDE
ncbi:zinc finger protein 235-like [Culicoides brevitarsis]|uniref:zinc finger protein 235-like n=1 Tax=Culicoides brevitarsis TaxID=469753 RepID=UPI00307C6ED5